MSQTNAEIREVVEAAAGRAMASIIQEVKGQFAVEIRLALAEFEKRFATELGDAIEIKVEKQFRLYFGNLEPHDHITDHFRVSKMLGFFENFNTSIWKSFLTFSAKALGVVLLMYFAMTIVGPAYVKDVMVKEIKTISQTDKDK